MYLLYILRNLNMGTEHLAGNNVGWDLVLYVKIWLNGNVMLWYYFYIYVFVWFIPMNLVASIGLNHNIY